jgi:hypothetical protein
MIPLLKQSLHDLFFNPEFARTRLRAIIGILGTAATGIVASGALEGVIESKWAPVVIGIFASMAHGVGQGD